MGGALRIGAVLGNGAILGNPMLSSLPDFASLRSVGDSLVIRNNAVLRSIPSFFVLRSVGSALDTDETPIVILFNGMLSTCCGVFSFVQESLPTDYTLGGDGMLRISNNATGCASAAEIIAGGLCPHTVVVSTSAARVLIGPEMGTTIPIDLLAAANTIAFTIDLGNGATDWRATEASDTENFLSDLTASGADGEQLTISYSENESHSRRTATIRLSTTGPGISTNKTLSLTQAATPSITSFSPRTGRTSDVITIRGTGFSAIAVDNDVSFGGAEFSISRAADAHEVNADGTEIKVRAPSSGQDGKLRVRVGGFRGTIVTSTEDFTFVTPSITGFSPSSAGIGEAITITGAGFDREVGRLNNRVSFGGLGFGNSRVAAAFEVNSDGTEIKVQVPRDAESGKLRVETASTLLTSLQDFTLVAHAITDFSPRIGNLGDVITITGRGFVSKVITDGNYAVGDVINRVSFASSTDGSRTSANVFEVDEALRELKVRVPEGARSGKIELSTVRVNTIGSNDDITLEILSSVRSTHDFTLVSQAGLASIFGVSRAKSGVVLYPNPLSERLYIGGLRASAFVRISTLSGVVVQSAVVSASSSSVDVSDLRRGTYLVVIKRGEAVLSKRLVIIE